MNLSIDEIRKLVNNNNIRWRGHILKRMHQRGIKIHDIINSINNGEIIEYYENDYPFPSCLVLGFIDSKGLHIVCAVGKGYVWMITAYYPDKNQWYEDLKNRRK